MRIKSVTLIGLLFLLVSCGGSKKAVQQDQNQADSVPLGVGNFPRLDQLPNPLEEDTPDFKSDIARYIYQYKDVAMEEMREFGIPASITLAQGLLESGAGMSELARKSNNHFGIKCHGWDGQKVYHDDDRRHECFRKYKNPLYSYRDHSLFLTSRSRYDNLFELVPDDYKGWARTLKKDGYATDPAYPRKLIGIIKRYDLDKYDRMVLENKAYYTKRQPKRDRKEPPAKEAYYIVKKGDTLYSISKRFGLSVSELKAQNGIDNNLISIGQRLDVSQ